MHAAGLIHDRSLTLRAIDRAFGFEDAPVALAYLRSGGHLGKIVIQR